MSVGFRLGVVVNPTAGSGRGDTEGRQVVSALRQRGHDVHDLSAPDLAAATASARQGVVDGLDALIVVGGDGMTHLGVNVVASTTLPLGIVAVGTGNDIARGLGLPTRSIASAIAQIEQRLQSGPRVIDAVTVASPARSMHEWFAGALSAGFDAAVNERANALHWPNGSARYIRALLQPLRRYRPYGYKITVDEQVWESAGALVLAANGPWVGGGMQIAPDAEFDDGLLDVVVAGPVNRATLIRIFPQVYRGKHVKHPAVSVLRGRRVLLEATDAGREPPASYADGERIGPLPLRCEVVPGALRVLAPPAR